MPSTKHQARHIDALSPFCVTSKSRQQNATPVPKEIHFLPVNKTFDATSGRTASSMTITASTLDLLTSLPAEILIQIIAHMVPFYSIFWLNQVSRPIRTFIRSQAGAICNAVMRIHLPHRLALLNTKAVDGWCLPTHPDLLALEAKHEAAARKAFGLAETWKFPARISEPGPQFMFVLPFLFRINKKAGDYGGEKIQIIKKDDVKIQLDYRVYCLLNGLDWYPHPTDPKPRRWGLTWYFGVPKDGDVTTTNLLTKLD